MKYVLFEDSNGRKIPVVFPDVLVHEDVANALLRADVHSAPMYALSAGFISIPEAATHGNSETLKLESRPIDGIYVSFGDAVAMMPEEMLLLTWGSLMQQKPKSPKRGRAKK